MRSAALNAQPKEIHSKEAADIRPSAFREALPHEQLRASVDGKEQGGAEDSEKVVGDTS